jgi:hypothetical protein
MPSSKGNQHAANQDEIYRNMSGQQRLELMFEMSMREKESTKARIRKEHPDWNEQQVARELLRLEFLPNPLPKGF